ncbi:MAG: SBBP repeat-containing protein [Bacteroidota bacterium]
MKATIFKNSKPMKKILLILIAAIYYNIVSAQIPEQWVNLFNGQNNGGAVGYAITTDANGYIYTTGEAYDTNGTGVFIIKGNPLGDTIWLRYFPGPRFFAGPNPISPLIVDKNDNVYILAGEQDSLTGQNLVTLKYDSSGVFQWSATYNGPDSLDDYPRAIAVDDSGNVYITGHSKTALLNNPTDIVTIKYNSLGLQQWIKFYDDPSNKDDYAGLIAVDDSGNVYVTGHKGPTTPNMMGFITIKYNSAGIEQWNSAYSNTSGYNLQNVPGILQVDSSGNVYVCGGFNYNALGDKRLLIIKYNSLGDTLWTAKGIPINSDCCGFTKIDFKQDVNGNIHIAAIQSSEPPKVVKILYDSGGNDLGNTILGTTFFDSTGIIYNIKQDENYNIYLSGINYTVINSIYESKIITVKINSNGNEEWGAIFNPGGEDLACGLALDNAENVYITGWSYTPDWSMAYAPIIKYCGRCNSIIRGNIFIDLNADCIKDSTEVSFKNLIVQATPGPYYATTDSIGYYAILVPQGAFIVNEIVNSYWNILCPVSGNYSVTLVDSGDVSFNNNFANEIGINCPLMTVDISTWALRPCSTSVYTVQYCNNGTIAADSAYIEVEFDNDITPVSSTLNWSSQNGNIYTFNIGTVVPQQCSNFYITANVSCNALLGSTHCIEAHIYPDSICTPVDSVWDKSSIKVTGNCVNDSLACFTIKNKGSGNMQGTCQYRIYENNVVVQTGTFQLSSGDSVIICYPANGNTIRLEADQRPNHPGNSHPQDQIELCGVPFNVMGMITQVPEDDADDFIETDCRQITAAIDPNEKQVKPAGISTNHFIDSLDILEYQINFQNTGTDTAFRVVIRDTLTNYLDITTVQSGASSNPYSFRIYGQGILEWTLNNILLPDSNTNEAMSHGFVRFKVKQITGNNIGTIIENNAAIYFDYNAPVITNTAYNTIWKEPALSVSTIYQTNKIFVYPNPSNGIFTISSNIEINSIEIYNLLGERIYNSFIHSSTNSIIDLSSHPNGIYFITVKSANNVSNMKILKQ